MAWIRLGAAGILCIGLFEKLFEFALILIKKGKAYVCDLSADEIRSYRGTLTSPVYKALIEAAQ